jgi:DNA-binding transcriptional LysR family regulator
MELRQLRYFEAVARHLHFTRAAQELFVAQPALSLQIQRMESELGTRLFHRTTRSVRLTEAGKTLLPSARRVLAETADAHARLRDLANLDSGRVALGAQQSLNASGMLPQVLGEFRARNPGVDVVLREDSAEASLAMLTEGSLDFALAMLDGEAADADLHVESLYDEQVVFVVGQGHPRARGAVELRELITEPFIAFNETAGLRRMLVRACVDAGFQPRIGYESSALGSIRSLAAAGLGVGLLPLPSVRAPGPPVEIVDTGTTLSRTISLVRPARRYDSAAARALAGLLRERLPTASA